MGRRLKHFDLWIRRKSNLPIFLVGGLAVMVLFLNEDTSLTLNMKYQKEIARLNREIKLNKDSAAYYRAKREALLHSDDKLEHIAREQYNMQKPGEDVYIIDP